MIYVVLDTISSMMRMMISLGGHVCMPVCIRIVFKLLCFCSLFLLQAAHVANIVVYIVIYLKSMSVLRMTLV